MWIRSRTGGILAAVSLIATMALSTGVAAEEGDVLELLGTPTGHSESDDVAQQRLGTPPKHSESDDDDSNDDAGERGCRGDRCGAPDPRPQPEFDLVIRSIDAIDDDELDPQPLRNALRRFRTSYGRCLLRTDGLEAHQEAATMTITLIEDRRGMALIDVTVDDDDAPQLSDRTRNCIEYTTSDVRSRELPAPEDGGPTRFQIHFDIEDAGD